MRKKSELERSLAETQERLAELRRAEDPVAVAAEMAQARAVVDVLRERLAEYDAGERAAVAAKQARELERQRQQQESDLRARADVLTQQWQRWGASMSEIDAEVRSLWREYRQLAAATLAVGQDAHAAGAEVTVDTGTQAGDIGRRIAAGDSPLKDWRR